MKTHLQKTILIYLKTIHQATSQTAICRFKGVIKMIIAVDPGKSGAVSWMHDCVVLTENTPETEGDIVSLFLSIIGMRKPGESAVMYIEQLNGYAGGTGQPGSMMFTMAKYYWCWIFLAHAFDIRHHLVTPQKWQKEINIGKRGTLKGSTPSERYRIQKDWKNKLKAEAQRLYPMLGSITLNNCDSLLILEYARKINMLPEPQMPF
jgi:hypothetical protein